MAKTAILAVRIIGDSKNVEKSFDRTESKLGKVGKVAGGAVVAGVAAAGTAVVGLGVIAGKSASDLEQSVGAIDTVFKGNADQMHTWAKGAAQDVGLTRDQFNGLGTLIGTQLKNGGTAMDQLAPKTNELIGLGADLSSMFGGDTKTAVEALSSALKGERDPIEKYGVSLTQASIDAKAAEMGFKKVGGSLSAEANQAATLAIIMDQTSDAHGNFAKESSTVAGQQQRLVASGKNLITNLGTHLLPILLTVFTFLNKTAVPAVTNLIDSFISAGKGGGLAEKLGLPKFLPLLQAMGARLASLIPIVVSVFQNHIVPAAQMVASAVIPVIQTLVTKVLPVAVSAFTAVASAVVPVIGQLVTLIATISSRLMPIVQALLPVVMTIFTQVKNVIVNAMAVVSSIISTVMSLVTGDWSGAWEGIKSIASTAGTLLGSIISGAWEIIKSLWTAGVDNIVSYISTLPGKVATWATEAGSQLLTIISNAWEDTKTATTNKIGDLVGYVAELPGKILDKLGNMGTLLYDVGKDVISGLLNGIKSMGSSLWNGVKSLVADNIPGPIRKVLGIASPSKVTAKLGAWTGEGLAQGLISQAREVEKATRKLLGTPEKLAQRMEAPELNLHAVSRRSSSRSSSRAPLVINVNGALDPMAVARQIKQLLADHDDVVIA